jgi:hypothetical protein
VQNTAASHDKSALIAFVSTPKNRHFCMRSGIRLSSKRIGKRLRNQEGDAAHKQWLLADQRWRNEVED